MCVGMFLFAANDALGKKLVGSYSVGELMVARGVTGLLITLPLLWRARLPLLVTGYRPGLQVVRFLLSPAEASFFFWALISLPLAEVITYYQASPIWVTALSALFLRERVGWRRWSAVCAGFLGVVVALHPAGSVSIGALSALLGSLLYAGFLIATGRLPEAPRSVLIVQQLLATCLLGIVVVLIEGWTMPGPQDAALMLVLGVGSLAGNSCVNYALRLGPAVSIVPFEYTMLLWGILLGYLVFGDLPGAAALTGAAIIIGAGLFILVREHRLATGAAADAPNASAPQSPDPSPPRLYDASGRARRTGPAPRSGRDGR